MSICSSDHKLKKWIEYCQILAQWDGVIFNQSEILLYVGVNQSFVCFQIMRYGQKHTQCNIQVILLLADLYSKHLTQWLVLSRLPVNPPEERLQENSWPPRPLVRAHLQLVESRNHTDTGQELLLSEKSEDTKKAQSFWSENSHSRD